MASDVEAAVSKLTVRELKAFAKEHRIDVKGCRRKADYVARIAADPAAAKLVARGAGEAAKPDLSYAEADGLVQQARNLDVDFGLVEDILDQTRMRFEERNYDRTLELAREALMLARGTLDAFERSAWGYALLAAERLIEESDRVGRDVDPAAALLRDAKVAYVSGNLGANRDLLMKLQSATKALYSKEVQRLRDAMYVARERMGHAKHIGADVGAADGALVRAQDAMDRAEHSRALALVAEAERFAAEALALRVKELGEMIPATAKLLEEARNVGADVDEAARFLEKAEVAMERKEYVLAGELVQRAERAALQEQHFQIQKAMELRMRQIEKAQGVLLYLQPVIAEAADLGLDVAPVRRLVADARHVLDEGDYVNGTVIAKQAEDAVHRLEPQLVEQRKRHGIVKPASGRCETCNSLDVAFLDDGWSRCRTCNAMWRWRVPSGLWERFRSLLRE